MKKTFRFPIFLTTVLFCFTASGQLIIIRQSNERGVYKEGDKAAVFLSIPNNSTDSVNIGINRNFAGSSRAAVISPGNTEKLIFSAGTEKPGSVIFEISTASDTTSIGLVLAPEKLRPASQRPADFDLFWDNEKKRLHNLPMVVKNTPVTGQPAGYDCFDTEINCTGPKPVRGYFSKPASARPRSLPIVIYFHAAGVKGSWCLAQPAIALRYAQMGKGALSFDMNAHGMLNGQPQQYYDSLEQTELKDYAVSGINNKTDIYFRGMYLRIIRAIDFLTSQPEWDGRRILVIGESQGGGQALVAAGLDHRVSAVVATVPAMCDWGAAKTGGKGGWPNPLAAATTDNRPDTVLPYFDAAHILTNSKATIVVEIGLIDYTCPATGIYAAINQATGKKIVYAVPYRAHHMDQLRYKHLWEETVYTPKETFVRTYLQ